MKRDEPKPERDWSRFRFPAHTAFINNHLANMTGDGLAAPLVWFVLWEWAGHEDGTILGASVKRLCETTGLAKNTVKAALKTLRAARLITVYAPRAGFVPVYKLNANLGPKKAKRPRPND